MIKFLLIIWTLVYWTTCAAQDTLSFYFPTNSASLSDNDERVLHNLSTQYDLASLDSILFIGFTDSVGNFRSNIRLSERRATNAYKECKTFLDGEIPVRIEAKGENIRAENWQSRRVEIIFFFQEVGVENQAAEIIAEVDPRCFLTDFEALQFCHVREFVKGKRTYVQIEAMNVPLFKERKHYYVLFDQKGKATVQRLNWKLKTTGRSWWKKQRLVATMPKTSFDKFQFFTLQNSPCSGCSETIFTKDTIIRTIPKYYPDLFLMDNLQSRLKLFGKKNVQLRVPKEYVNLQETYFYSTDPYTHVTNNTIEWTEKKGKRKEEYYFATIQTSLFDRYYIKKLDYTTICLNKYEYSDHYSGILCGGVGSGGSISFHFITGPGVFMHNDTTTSYFTLGVLWHGLGIHAGINHRQGFYGSVNWDVPIFQFPIASLRLNDRWQNVNEPMPKIRYARIYAGAELRTSFTKSYPSFFEGNLHLKTNAFLFERRAFYSELYLQGGYSYDFLRRINTAAYPYVEAGWKFHFSW